MCVWLDEIGKNHSLSHCFHRIRTHSVSIGVLYIYLTFYVCKCVLENGNKKEAER